jgi:aspartyl-tRNA(Asn)/glutamyl-tRNA(Gln) amidotransferase subunit A
VQLPRFNPYQLRRAALLVIEAEGWQAHSSALEQAPHAYSDELKAMLTYGRDLPPQRLQDAYDELKESKMALAGLFDQIDLLASPTAPQTAVSFTDPAPTNQPEFTAWANILGGPALTLPNGLAASGLPLALQLMAPVGMEKLLLGTGQTLEEIWGRFSPPHSDGFSAVALGERDRI